MAGDEALSSSFSISFLHTNNTAWEHPLVIIFLPKKEKYKEEILKFVLFFRMIH